MVEPDGFPWDGKQGSFRNQTLQQGHDRKPWINMIACDAELDRAEFSGIRVIGGVSLPHDFRLCGAKPG